MNCKNCGNIIQDGMLQCTMCGTKVDQQQSQQYDSYSNQGNGFQDQQQGQQQQQNWNNNGQNYGGNFQQQAANAPENTLFLVLGAIYCLCCCNFLIGIPALIFTVLMNNAYKEGRIADYNSNRNVAKWIYIGGIVLWIITVILGMVFNIFGAITGSIVAY